MSAREGHSRSDGSEKEARSSKRDRKPRTETESVDGVTVALNATLHRAQYKIMLSLKRSDFGIAKNTAFLGQIATQHFFAILLLLLRLLLHLFARPRTPAPRRFGRGAIRCKEMPTAHVSRSS